MQDCLIDIVYQFKVYQKVYSVKFIHARGYWYAFKEGEEFDFYWEAHRHGKFVNVTYARNFLDRALKAMKKQSLNPAPNR